MLIRTRLTARRISRLTLSLGLIALVTLIGVTALAQGPQRTAAQQDDGADWPMFLRDLAGTRFSPLKDINTENVNQLKIAWNYNFNRPGKPITGASSSELYQEITPIVVDGIMYTPSGDRVVALDPTTGKEIWVHELDEGNASFRGVSYWPGDAQNPPRILFTHLKKLTALNATTGRIDPGFGKEGSIDLEVPYAGAPIVYGNLMFIGTNFYGPGMQHINPALDQRAGQIPVQHGYDVRTGQELWSFNTLPMPGEFGYDTWPEGAAQQRTGNNVWAFSLTLDEERGILYMPVSGPGGNFYGGDRMGMNLFGNTLVAVDTQTGKLLWHFQTVHHELWDYNLPPAPSLIDIEKDGQIIPALAQVGKSGWMYILNRVTGEPIYGVEERAVPASNVPGEQAYPTQPIPLKPPPIARVSMTKDDIVRPEDTTPEHSAACMELWETSGLYNAGPFTPFPWGEAPGARPAIIFPGLTGGANWGGTTVDPELGYIFVNTKDAPAIGWMIANPEYKEGELEKLPYIRSSPRGLGSFSRPVRNAAGETIATWPCFRPPWGRLIAVNAKTGDFAWEVPLGITESMPEGKQNTGSSNSAGSMVTAGRLLFIGSTGDKYMRAFDTRTGREIWHTVLPYTATAVPMTYRGKDGKQYVSIVAASGGGFGPSGAGDQGIYTFALPE